jgi:NADPH:quinone reductase-like Zn-dependent oxidoreductase
MKAIQIRSHGGLEVLQSATLPDPTPKAGEVLVRVRASALNPLDSVVRKGHFPIAAKPPLTLGEEASGLIERDGAGFQAGQRVIVYGGGLGVFRDGTWADLVAVPATSVRKLPEGISFEEGSEQQLAAWRSQMTPEERASLKVDSVKRRGVPQISWQGQLPRIWHFSIYSNG